MKKAFPGHFAHDPDDLERLWDDSLIVLDANVLLNLYRYSENTRNEFLEVFEKLKDRLWISHQVANEYLRSRLKVISDQAKTYDVAISGLEDLRKNFEDPKQHPFVSQEVLGDCTRSFDLIIGELKANKARHDGKINDDDIKHAIALIFDGKVGEPYSNERLEEIIVDGAKRYENKIPPGFKDANKPVGKTLEERLAPFGDYVVWLQLLDKAKAETSSVIFVTGDNKEDWWLKQSGKTLGPLPALIEEFIRVTSQRFYMYPPDRFLERAGMFLKQTVSAQAMEEAREVRLHDADQVPVVSDSSNQHGDMTFFNVDDYHEYSARSPRRWRDYWRAGKKVYGALSLDNLRIQAAAAKYELSALTAERAIRLEDGPTDSFSGVSDEDLENLIKRKSDDLNDILVTLEVMKSFSERKPEN